MYFMEARTYEFLSDRVFSMLSVRVAMASFDKNQRSAELILLHTMQVRRCTTIP